MNYYKEGEVMEFKIGDVVKVIGRDVAHGKVGVIVSYLEDDKLFGVDFEENICFLDGFRASHNLDGVLKRNTGRYFYKNELELNSKLIVELL